MDDLEFVRQCTTGDKQAWVQFTEKYSRLIYRYIHSVLQAKGYTGAEESVNDIFQEVFLSLVKDDFKKLKGFQARQGASLASWLRQVVINHALDFLRRQKPAFSLDEEDDEGKSLSDILADTRAGAAQMLDARALLGHLAECIDQLNTDEHYFIELHINQRVPLEKLKSHLGLSRSAVDMRKARILARLRECFGRKGIL